MASKREALRDALPALGVAVPVTIVFVAVLGIVLTAAGPQGLGLATAQTSTWIVAIYGLPAIPSVALAIRYRQPLLLTGNVFAVIFFGSLGTQFSFAELAGASLLAGAIVVLAAVLGLTRHLANWIPAPVVQGLIAGAVMPFVVSTFTGLSTVDTQGVAVATRVPLMVGGALVAYLASRRLLGERLPPILPAVVGGLAVATLTGQLGPLPSSVSRPELILTAPTLALSAVVSVTPVVVILIVLQSNLPSIVFMQSQGFRPPARTVDVVSGIGTMVGSILGPTAMSLALPLMPLTAGSDAGDLSIRYRSVFLPAGALVLIALLAGSAAQVADIVPPPLLVALAGLALIGVLMTTLQAIGRGPLIIGPVFAFAIALSKMSVFGLGPFFWSIFLGTAVTLLLERDAWNQIRAAARSATESPGAPPIPS